MNIKQPFIEIPLKIETITPVHIGMGEDYYPTDYVIKDGRLYFIDRNKFTVHLKQNGKWEEFCNVCKSEGSNSISDIRKFVQDNFDESCSLYDVKVSRQVEEKYKDDLKKFIPNNQLIINRTYRTGINQEVVIPGSSIKGAFMTALSNYLSLNVSNNHDFGKLIKFSDFNLVQGSVNIQIIKNSKNEKLENKRETISSNSIFIGKVIFNNNLNILIGNGNDYWKKLTQGKLYADDFENDFFYILNNFYEKNEENEDENVQSVLDLENNIFNNCAFLKNYIAKENSSLIKLGCHSGAYAVTLHPEQENNIFNNQLFETVKKIINNKNLNEASFENEIKKTKNDKVIKKYYNLGYKRFKDIFFFNGSFNRKANQDKMFYMDHQTTTWITEQNKPMGWCNISAISSEKYQDSKKEIQNKNRQLFEKKTEEVNSNDTNINIQNKHKLDNINKEELATKEQLLMLQNKFKK